MVFVFKLPMVNVLAVPPVLVNEPLPVISPAEPVKLLTSKDPVVRLKVPLIVVLTPSFVVPAPIVRLLKVANSLGKFVVE